MNSSRRSFVGALALCTLSPRSLFANNSASSTLQDLEVRDLTVAGDRSLGRRFTLFIPRHLQSGQKVPLLVLLHGLGETTDERMGAFAWVERYGLGSCYDRLRRPPIARTSKRADFTDNRLSQVNAALAKQPFRGLVIACPYTPNVYKAPNPSAALDGYARWLADVVIPRTQTEAPVFSDAKHTTLDGCSLGGYVSIEIFLRRPDLFGAFGGVQAAFGKHRVSSYADRIATTLASSGPREIHLLTSQSDPFRDANTSLSAQLTKKGIPNILRILPGPHDQPWLREAGTLEMLLFHDQRPR